MKAHEEGTRGGLANELFPLQLTYAPKINQETSAQIARFQVVQQLRFLFAREPIDRFQLNNNLIVTKNIGYEPFWSG